MTVGKSAIPHELHHVEQVESRMLLGLVLGILSAMLVLVLGANWVQCIVALEVPWFGSWMGGYGASILQAYLRGEEPYKGSHLEEAAYSLTQKEVGKK